MNVIWITAASIRAIKTICQSAVAMIGSSALIEAIDWRAVLSASILAGILSILTSITGIPEVESTKVISEPPEIETEDVIDTSKEDAEYEGNLVPKEREV